MDFYRLFQIYVIITAAQFLYSIGRDYFHLRQTREHSRKLVAAQQAVAKEHLDNAFRSGWQAHKSKFYQAHDDTPGAK